MAERERPPKPTKEPRSEELATTIKVTAPGDVFERLGEVEITKVPDGETLPVYRGPMLLSFEFAGVREMGVKPMVSVPKIPHISWSTFDTPNLGWYRVTFPRAYTKPPTVISIAEYRGGWTDYRSMFRPARLNSDEVANKARSDAERAVKDALGDWGWLNWARDAVAWAGGVVGWIGGYLSAWLGNIILEFLASTAHESMYRAIDHLHQFSDRPRLKLTTSEVRNVKETSADVLGYKGGKVHIFAIG